ncbi:unnamed protein product, partial [Ectocarpus sp. 12 AP-2014]
LPAPFQTHEKAGRARVARASRGKAINSTHQRYRRHPPVDCAHSRRRQLLGGIEIFASLQWRPPQGGGEGGRGATGPPEDSEAAPLDHPHRDPRPQLGSSLGAPGYGRGMVGATAVLEGRWGRRSAAGWFFVR